MSRATVMLGRGRGRLAGVRLFAAAFVAVAPPLASQSDAREARLPFAAGERLTYRVTAGGIGIGRGVMSVDGPVDVRGVPAYTLRSSVDAQVWPMKGYERSETWIDPVRMAVLRSQRTEKTPFARKSELVDVFPDARAWRSTDRGHGTAPTDQPLDELSFLYYVRTLPLCPTTDASFVRHYDVDRNPVRIRVTGHQRVTTGAGTFNTFVVEMSVTDPRRYRNGAVITLYLSDDRYRIPVRIEGAMPAFGTAVFTLESVVHGER